jgi:tetratricopeptide (TPR) repeat protein
MKFAVLFFSLLVLNGFCYAQAYNAKKIDSIIGAGNFKEAQKLLEAAIKNTPKNEDALRSLGKLYLSLNEPDKAIEILNKALQLNINCVNCFANIAIANAQKQNYKEALIYINKAITIEPTKTVFLITRGEIFSAAKQFKNALSDYNKGVQLEPKNTKLLLSRSNYFRSRNENLNALNDFDAAINLEPKNDTLLYERANFYYQSQLFEEAKNDISQAIKLNPKNDNYFVGLGAAFASLNKLDSAELAYKNAIILNTENYNAYYNLYLSAYKKEDMDASCGYLQKAISLGIKKESYAQQITEMQDMYKDACDLNFPNYYFQRGIANYNLKNYNQAINFYAQGQKKFPENTWLMQFMGNAYLATNNFNNAITQYNNCIKSETAFDKSTLQNPRYENLKADSLLLMRYAFFGDTYKSLAKCYLGLQNYIEALKQINNGIAITNKYNEPFKEDFYSMRADIYNEVQKFAEAKQDMDKAIIINAKVPELYISRAVVNYNWAQQNTTKPTIKVKTLTFSITRNGINNVATLPIYSKAKLVNNYNLLAVIADCNKAIALKTDNKYVYYLRGLAKMQLGQAGFCDDILKAKALGVEIDNALHVNCK